jgi:hypothetical protein
VGSAAYFATIQVRGKIIRLRLFGGLFVPYVFILRAGRLPPGAPSRQAFFPAGEETKDFVMPGGQTSHPIEVDSAAVYS